MHVICTYSALLALPAQTLEGAHIFDSLFVRFRLSHQTVNLTARTIDNFNTHHPSLATTVLTTGAGGNF